MIHIAIVEDDPRYQKQLSDFIAQYQADHGEQFKISLYANGMEIVEHYALNYDIILLDIQMELMDGMETAQRIREIDKDVVLIFITNLPQFALQGYEVEALSYLLKPINSFAFAQELHRAVVRVKETRSEAYLHIMQKNGLLRLTASHITYVESQGNDVIYHTLEGDYTARDSLKGVEEKLPANAFYRCNNCYLVNLAQVERVNKNEVVVAGAQLQISRLRKKGFMEALAAYVGGK